MENSGLKKHVLEIVDNQIKDNDPPCTKDVYQKLQYQGCDRQEAKEMIASVLLEELYYIMKDNRPFDEQKYEEALYALLEDSFVFDGVEQTLEDEILPFLYQIDDALFEGNEGQAVRVFLQAWEKIRELVKEKFYKKDKKGNLIKPELIDVDDATDFRYDLYNLIQDMDLYFLNAGMYEEAIRFFRELMELFAWEEEPCDQYRAGIGEALNGLGNYEECDRWFEDWLKDEPENPCCINMYGWCLTRRGDLEKAKNLIETHVTDSMECNLDNEMAFVRGEEIYRELGDKEKEKEFAEKAAQCLEALRYYELDELDEYDDFDGGGLPFYPQQPLVKEKKIYPNEPCPCGSGKKYKKCCGRN